MFLRRLDVTGFKSFPDKTSLEFSPGLTAIVGPNGSGKSNLADAVRWVLGGQSARLLRTSRMDEVIFSGTDRRKPLNLAKVRLTLDNQDGALTVPFSEVQISRQLSRDGESIYQINGTNCRLKDIVHLFAGTGLGRDSYSLIGQGRVDEMINAHGDERRQLLEEAAGITRYRNQRAETLRRLDNSQRDLQRLDDIMLEVERQLGPLQEQAQKAHQYRHISQRLRKYEIADLAVRLEKNRTTYSSGRSSYERHQQELLECEQQLACLEEMLDLLRREGQERQQQWQTAERAVSEAEAREREYRIRQEAGAATQQALTQEMNKMDQRLALLMERVQSRQHESEQCQKAQEDIQERLNQSEQAYAERDAELAERRAQLLAWEQQVDSAKSDAIETLNEAAAQRNRMRSQELEQSHLEKMRHRLQQEMADLDDAHRRWEELGTHLMAELADLQNRQKALRQQAAEQSRQTDQWQGQLAALHKEKEKHQSAIDQRRSRLAVVEDMVASYEGYGRGPRQLLQAARKTPTLTGVLGSVADLLVVQPDYQIAIEAALGGALQYIITETDGVAEQCITYLKRQRSGRATFLPLNLVRPMYLSSAEQRVLHENTSACSALSVVNFEESLSAAIKHLLGRVIVAHDLQQALSIGRQTGLRSRIATLAGELIAPGGVLSGGGRPAGSSSLLGRQREVSELRAQLEKYRAGLAHLEGAEERLLSQLANLSQDANAMQRELAGVEVKSEAIEAELRTRGAEGSRLARQQEACRSELESLHEQVIALHESMSQVAATTLQMEELADSARSSVQQHSQQYETRKQEYETALNALTDLRVTVAELRETRLRRQEQLKRADADLQEVEAELAEHTAYRRQVEERHDQVNRELEALRQQLVDGQTHCESLKQELLERRQAYDATVENLVDREKEQKHCERKRLTVQGKVHTLELETARLEVEIAHISQQLRSRYGLDPEDLDGEFLSAEDGPYGVAELREQLAQLGEVNLGAIAEYERLTERFEFLQKQRSDVQTACEDLRRVIAETDKQIESMFATTLQAVRSSFQHLFRRLFGGGTADLVPSDGDSPLQSGIEIVVQPPGRKLRNINLLSGGEKALTAIALLFALLTIRPCPFCFLDEIEAALDDSNADRFIKLLREFAPRTQFILISHHKTIMEAADVLYGITMEETGVSRLISVNLVEVAGGQT